MNIENSLFNRQVEEIGVEKAVGRIFLRELSNFVWEKYDDRLVDERPKFKEIEKELSDYGITDMTYNVSTQILTINSFRPGVLIGVRGSNIDQIDKHFKKYAAKNNIPYKTLKLNEDKCPFQDDLMYSIISYQME
jgi:hypothetical protein